MKTHPCLSSTEVSHPSIPPVLGCTAGIFSIALDSCQRSPGSTETTRKTDVTFHTQPLLHPSKDNVPSGATEVRVVKFHPLCFLFVKQ